MTEVRISGKEISPIEGKTLGIGGLLVERARRARRGRPGDPSLPTQRLLNNRRFSDATHSPNLILTGQDI